MLAFVALSLLVSMSLSQELPFEVGSPQYWLLLLSATLLPLSQVGTITGNLLGRAWWLLLMLLLAGAWHLRGGDPRAVIQLGLLVWVMAWVASDRARLRIHDLTFLYLLLLAIGCAVYLGSDLNKWGLLPGQTTAEFGVWRVSFFPNIAYSALLSLALVMLLTRDRRLMQRHRAILLLALYFVIFSFVRSALIALAMYAFLRWWFARGASPRRLFWSALLLGVGVNAAIAGSVVIFEWMQQVPLLTRLFLRGETGLSTEEIFQQLYRPWLWWQQWQMFISSPALMGLGTYDFVELRTEVLIEGHTDGDSVSLPTRLLVAYGLPGALFTAFLVARLRAMAWLGDAWGCACFAPVFLLLMQWGSAFHPTDALFALFMLMILRGSLGFIGTSARPSARPAA